MSHLEFLLNDSTVWSFLGERGDNFRSSNHSINCLNGTYPQGRRKQKLAHRVVFDSKVRKVGPEKPLESATAFVVFATVWFLGVTRP